MYFLGFVPRPTRLDFDESSDGQSSGVEDLLPVLPEHTKRPAPPPPHQKHKPNHSEYNNKHKVQVSAFKDLTKGSILMIPGFQIRIPSSFFPGFGSVSNSFGSTLSNSPRKIKIMFYNLVDQDSDYGFHAYTSYRYTNTSNTAIKLF